MPILQGQNNQPPAQLLMKNQQAGFALVAVLFLSSIIAILVPLMLTLNQENISTIQHQQSQALADDYARQIFMMAHATLLMNGGLPLGWAEGDSTGLDNTSAINDLENCSAVLDRSEAWQIPNARVSWMQINDDKQTTIIAGIYRRDNEDLPYDQYVVMGCAIIGGGLPQASTMRGEFARTGQQMLMLSLASGA